jgi:histidine ammonia-lyase
MMLSQITDAREGVVVTLDGRRMTVGDVAALVDGGARAALDPYALEGVQRSWLAATELAAAGPVYGRTTGVGVNRMVAVVAGDIDSHGLRLLRSHAGAIGGPVPGREARAMIAVRLNQLLAGGAGLRTEVVAALAQALDAGAHPVIHEYGAVGTGDIAALAQLGLALVGEHPWEGGSPPAPIAVGTGDALALISSNALTLGQSALALHELRGLLRATHAVGALSLLAVGGSLEAYAAPVHAARPHPGAVASAAETRRFLGAPDCPATPSGARIQDPYAFRCLPQIHGTALDAADALDQVLRIEINAAAENPLIRTGPSGPSAWHHGNFFTAHTALSLDMLRLAVLQTAQLSAARIDALADPGLTGLRPFLADGPSAGSGVMILEYAAAAALAELRTCATPATLGNAVLSRGLEEQASFASQGARLTLRAVTAFRHVLACELVTALRALRQHALVPDLALPVGQAYTAAAEALASDMADRPLTGDVAVAAGLLDGMGGL